MPHVALDTVLNLLWVGIGVSALAWAWRRERRRFHGSTLRARLTRVAAVALVSLALFPSVSDSDDLFNFSLFEAPLGHGGVGKAPPEDSRENTTPHLERLLGAFEHYPIARTYTFALALFSISILIVFRPEYLTRTIRCLSGRAPPIA